MGRRDFLRLVAHGGGALLMATLVPGLTVRSARAAASAPFADPEAFIEIAADNRITLISKHLEMGQGVLTGLATALAEELDADWAQLRYRFAPGGSTRHAHRFYGMHATGGSSSMAEACTQMRLAGAACRMMLQSAAAAIWRVPADEVRTDGGWLKHVASDRRASYGDCAAAAARLPVPADIPLKPATAFRLIGRPLVRLDGNEKCDGTARFGIDVRRPGLVRAVLARPPRFGGRLRSVDDGAARRVPGVLDVLTVPAGVAVVARNSWAAMRGRDALRIDWDDGEAEKRSSDAILSDFRRTDPRAGAVVVARGDVTADAPASARSVTAEYSAPLLAHAPMEPLNATMELRDDGADVWCGSQIPTLDRAAAAAALGLRAEQVTLHTTLAGGSFGRRTSQDYVVEAAQVTKAWGRRGPLQLLWTRSDDLQHGWYRPHFLHRLRGTLDDAGRLIAWQQQVVGPSIVAGTPMESMMRDGIDPTSVYGATDPLYDVPNLRVTLVTPANRIKLLAWRSVGHSHSGFAMESFVDELAATAKVDPLEFRLKMLGARPDLARLLQFVADRAGWGRPLPAGSGRGVALREAFGTRVAQVAEVTLRRDGAFSVDRVVCAVDCGLALNPDIVAAQIEGGIGWGLGAALQDAVTLRDGVVEQSNFDSYRPLRLSQMPRVEVHILPSDAPLTGVGELGVPAIAPAVANALVAAGAPRTRDLPFLKS